jgi:ABC-type antimicrobial peptide transport system permease subunit
MMDVKKLAQVAGAGGRRSMEVQKQINLPWSDAFRISLKNVILRLGRAAITATGIVLGVAFLTYVWADRVFSDGVEKARLQQEQTLAAAAESVRKPTTPQTTTEQTPTGQPGAPASGQPTKAEKDARQLWLVIMSLLVCGIGITNSMLMSVTERFQEIGTMKCLGALDSFIVRLFLIESAVIGVLGSVLGLLIGFLFVLLYYGIMAGFSVTGKLDWGTLLTHLLAALIIGTCLAFMAAIPPAIRAAQMPPAAALRTEI